MRYDTRQRIIDTAIALALGMIVIAAADVIMRLGGFHS
jgi:hypothetical protein